MVRQSAKQLFDFYLNSSIHVALAVTAFTAITMFNLRMEIDYNLLFFVFFSTIIGYNITKYSGSHESGEEPQPLSKSILIFSLICLLPLFYFMYTQSWAVIIVSGLMGLMTVSYSWPVLWRRSNLRDITSLKIFVIAFVWSTVTVVLPLLAKHAAFGINALIEYGQRFVFVLVLTLPFDIRDVRFDTYQLATIPQIIGIKRSRVFGVFLLCLVAAFEFSKTPILIDQALILIGVSIFTGFLVMQSVVQQTQYYASFWVESVPIIWCALLFLI
ncbi:hypothetical protein [Rhodohalobacter sp. 614A]|uniref:hypothetical protein n=1 Tax=Rhodohalobacter sp. 614A TaxID=2908649 RepID=UPI001F330440|nr:hypothetical protein [Rhodohalobacter sp. 614A]